MTKTTLEITKEIEVLKARLEDIAAGATAGMGLDCESEECGKGCKLGRRRFRHAIQVQLNCGDIPDAVLNMGMDYIAEFIHTSLIAIDWSKHEQKASQDS